MAGSKTVSVAKPQPNQRTRRRKAANRRKLAAVRALAADYDVAPAINSADLGTVLDEVLRRCVADFRMAASEADKVKAEDFWVTKVDANGNQLVEPHPWVQYEKMAREELTDAALRMASIDLEGRRVAIAEAHAALLQRALKVALERLSLTPEQRRLLGPALREARALLLAQPAETANETITDAEAA
jgi:hypothetical protein